jgi:protein pelota
MVVEVNQKIVLSKQEWDSISLQRIQEACDISSKAEIGAVIMQEGLANVCLMTENMTVVKQRIELSIPKKRRGTTTQYDKGLGRFFDQITQAMLRYFRMDQLKVIIIASPGFLKVCILPILQNGC